MGLTVMARQFLACDWVKSMQYKAKSLHLTVVLQLARHVSMAQKLTAAVRHLLIK